MKDSLVRHRFSILLALVVALGINALAGLAGVGSAGTAAKIVPVVEGLQFSIRTSQPITIASGDTGTVTPSCAKNEFVVDGGFHSHGRYVIAPPSIVGSYWAGGSGWTVSAVVPKTASALTLTAQAACAQITRGQVTSG